MAVGQGMTEVPMEIIVKVIDQNDNRPEFTQDTFVGRVAEASALGTVVAVFKLFFLLFSSMAIWKID